MNAPEILALFQHAGISLIPKGEQIRLRAAAGIITDEHRALVRENRANIIQYLRSIYAGLPIFDEAPRPNTIAPTNLPRSHTPTRDILPADIARE